VPKTQPSRDPAKVNARVQKIIKKASELPRNQNILIYGQSDTGKTRLSASAPDVLVIDVNEQGTDSVRVDIDPYVYSMTRWQQINDVYWFLQSGDHPYKSVSLDGVTALATLCMNFILGEDQATDASRDPAMMRGPLWQKLTQLMKVQITNFRNLPMNVVFTALERSRTPGDDDDEDIEPHIGPDCTPRVAAHLIASVGTVGRLVKREVIVSKKLPNGKKKKEKQIRKRLLLASHPLYDTKDRNKAFPAYIDAPNLTEMLEQIYKTKKEA
jgi:AAA domain